MLLQSYWINYRHDSGNLFKKKIELNKHKWEDLDFCVRVGPFQHILLKEENKHQEKSSLLGNIEVPYTQGRDILTDTFLQVKAHFGISRRMFSIQGWYNLHCIEASILS